jgi:hypothetical protein
MANAPRSRGSAILAAILVAIASLPFMVAFVLGMMAPA